jgi:hypothetical protein
MRKTTHMQTMSVAVIKEALIRTLVYSQLFSFPLTKEELWRYLKSDKKIPRSSFEGGLKNLPSAIEMYHGYYFLTGKRAFVRIREKRKEISRKKLRIAEKTAHLLAKIPSIHFIGISGSLASKNAEDDDDIDLFIITRKQSLWISRLLALLVLSFVGIRRKKNATNAKDTVCINMLLEKGQLLLPAERQDMYTAHEIAQLYPLINKDKTHETFVEINSWITTFLPNALDNQKPRQLERHITENASQTIQSIFMTAILRPLDISAKILQLWKINKTRTTETVTDTLLAFHPDDPRKKLIETYKKHLKTYGIKR